MLPVLMLAALVAAFLLAIAAIFRFVPRDGARSISNHAASSRRTYWILAVTLVLTGIPTYYLLWRWFMPVLELPGWFSIVLIFGFTCLMLTAFVPDKPGWKHRVHWLVAYGVGITMIAIMFAIAIASQASAFSRLLALAFVVTGIGFLVLAFTNAWCRKRYLYFQASTIVCWVVLLLLVALIQ